MFLQGFLYASPGFSVCISLGIRIEIPPEISAVYPLESFKGILLELLPKLIVILSLISPEILSLIPPRIFRKVYPRVSPEISHEEDSMNESLHGSWKND